MRASPLEPIDMPGALETACKNRRIELLQGTNRNHFEPIACQTYSYESIDQYLRTMEQAPNLWLNLNIDFET
jgi:hypothetical protein